MKKLLLVVACLVIALAIAAPVKATPLTLNQLIGWVEPGIPSDYDHEIYYVNALLNMYNDDVEEILLHLKEGDKLNNYYLYTGNMNNFGVEEFKTLDLVPAPGIVKYEGDTLFFPINFSGMAYDYALVKFGGLSALFYLEGINSIDGVEIFLEDEFDLVTKDVSHVTLFNPIHVPEAGALLLFGSGLIGLVGYRRMRRMQ